MITIKLQDKLCIHEPSFFHSNNQNLIKISREQIIEGDIVIYTNADFKSINKKAKYNIAFICESYNSHKIYYDWIKLNYKKFDLVLTWNKQLLELDPEIFKLQLYGTTWINEKYRKIYKKTKICSMIASNKKKTIGHKLRHIVIKVLKNKKISIVDLFGGENRELPYPVTKGYDKDHSGQHETNKKILALKDYMFSICILPSKSDYEFDEKLIDCFLTGTVPIFWGCPSIDKFFNINGMLIFNNVEECLNIIKNLSIEKYNSMLPFIKENYETAKKYTRFKFNEEVILKLINK